ncbi:imelysin family protein [Thalassobius sp. Cn5-15]|uniref:imelysin family protein n=1 Tax=Thalassobius sp. Cn5-15 TaxID=2917763 RepID=UPI001EF285A8|nr:imelysin family protein [Thalassobius sp. Cn5-15]MCG7492848.1 imelysin family protein [Thalassobius sp. Cn5-15]
MLKPFATALALLLPGASLAQPVPERVGLVERVLDQHVLPNFADLAEATSQLAMIAAQDCTPDSEDLRTAYARAFDAWVRVSHLRFGPTEVQNRAFALAFWPDPRSKTPKALAQLLADQDVALLAPEEYTELSIAARGFYALEYLLYEPQLQQPAAYACALVQAGSADIARLSAAINTDWASYADQMRRPHADGPYKTNAEATQELFKALLTGLQFTTDMRLGRPLGTFERPRPKRAEARRSQRSQRHIALAVGELEELAALLSRDGSGLQAELMAAFEDTHQAIDVIDSPDLSSVATPFGWLQADIVRLNLYSRITEELMPPLGEELGVPAGFNALDGD